MGVYFGFANGMWQMALMSGVSVFIALLMRFRPNAGEVRLEIGKRFILVNGRPTKRPYPLWPKSWRSAYRLALDELRASSKAGLIKTRFGSLEFLAGFGLELDLVSDGPHLFLVGPTGSGKSKFLELTLGSMSGSPRLLLADYKGGATLARFGDCVTDLNQAEEREGFWQGLLGLLREREEYLALHGVSMASETSLEPILVVVDELAHALREDRTALVALSSVGARGRSLGVHLICASQSIAGIPRELLVNLSLRVILAGTDEVDALQLGAKHRPAKLNGLGSGLVVGGPEFRFPFRREPILENRQPFREP
jgi:hypothetical protein